MDYMKLKEESLKIVVRDDFFGKYKYTQLGNIDFVIAKHVMDENTQALFDEFDDDELKSVLWAEAKQGTTHDIYESFVQLILTIGKERTFEKYLPPKYIGAFDAEKFAFIEYHEIQHIFYQNDFNWNVTPSNHESKEFKQLHKLCEKLLEENSILFRYETQGQDLKEFIKTNFKTDKSVSEKISVTKNNFTFVFQKWSNVVKPTINVDWEKAKKAGIIAADFFLADLLSSGNESLKDSLYVVLKKTKYELAKKVDELGFQTASYVGFTDKQKAYKEFWSVYARPPKEEYWGYIIERRDLLVPQDIRERKGSFFTPQIWVEKSQQYLASVLGENWQNEYYVWDCCAGTGNLLNGLTNYRNVFASTLDKQDVDVMKDRIANGWSMFENHVFQFDFLNDGFDKCPDELREILSDENKRRKLVIYINPPYAEHGNSKQITGNGKNKSGVATETKVYAEYQNKIGMAARELYAQFLIRINVEIPHCKIAQFSKLKVLCASNFDKFRGEYQAKLEKLFVVPGNSFDNVKGQFPIGFFIWDGEKQETFEEIKADVFDSEGKSLGTKLISSYSHDRYVIDWLKKYHDKKNPDFVGYLRMCGTDMQHNKDIFVCNKLSDNDIKEKLFTPITRNNLIQTSIYCTIRHIVDANWLNDRDQFLYPKDDWEADTEFQLDSLVFLLFSDANVIKAENGTNHFIPFTEQQVGSKKTFKSDFMSRFLADFFAGKVSVANASHTESDLFSGEASGVKGACPLAVLGNGGGEGEENPRFRVEGCSSPSSNGGLGVSPESNGGLGELPRENTRGLGTSPESKLSSEAQAVYDSGLELWKYYHSQKNATPDASFYDIRKYFQGEKNGRGKARMNSDSDDETYTALIADLRAKQKALAKKIEAGVYKYGFLR
ncbi:MAG: hypothetical protein K6G18_06915 [Treponema sp.]|nr:hypothetical protein [Treponema sp.]